MRTVRHAVFGAMLASATLARADVITDWNQTAIEVMKVANVAGNPWTRSMAMVNVAMSNAVRASIRDRQEGNRRSHTQLRRDQSLPQASTSERGHHLGVRLRHSLEPRRFFAC